MPRKNTLLLILITCQIFGGCDPTVQHHSETSLQVDSLKIDSNKTIIPDPTSQPPPTKQPTTIAKLRAQGERWADIGVVAPDIGLDIRYATTNNFTGQQIYDCPKCLLRIEVAEALLEVQGALLESGYGVLLFDCFRPLAAQEKLWAIKPDKRYVTPPKKGSMHNRGAAVDITLTNLNGEPLDMGTDFDVFTKKAWHRYKDLPKQVIDRRILLKEHMERFGFKSITTEWWHYSYTGKQGYGIERNFWPCEEKESGVRKRSQVSGARCQEKESGVRKK